MNMNYRQGRNWTSTPKRWHDHEYNFTSRNREEARRLEHEKFQLQIERKMLDYAKDSYLKNEREDHKMKYKHSSRDEEKQRYYGHERHFSNKRPMSRGSFKSYLSKGDKRPYHYESQYYNYYKKSPDYEDHHNYRESAHFNKAKFHGYPKRDSYADSMLRSKSEDYDKKFKHSYDEIYKRRYIDKVSSMRRKSRAVERYITSLPSYDSSYKDHYHRSSRPKKEDRSYRKMSD